MNTPRIFMLADRYLPVVGGAETQAHALGEELIARGYSIKMITRRIHEGLPIDEVIGNILVHRLSPIGLTHKANIAILFTVLFYLLRQHKNFEILHVHGIGPLGIASILIAKILKKKVLLKVAGYGDLRRVNPTGIKVSKVSSIIRKFLLPFWLWRNLLSNADKIVAISSEIKGEAQSIALNENIIYIPNGVNVDYFKPALLHEKQQLKTSLDLPTGRIILFSGRLVEQKRGEVLIKAFNRLKKDFSDTYIVFLGTGKFQHDSVEEKLKQLVDELQLQEHIIFRGEVKNIVDYLQVSDIFAFPSEREGLPNALLEAMSCGLPSIASEIGGVIDVANKNTSWLVPPRDEIAFANALREALSDPREATRRGINAREKVLNEFSLSSIVSRYEQLYQELMK